MAPITCRICGARESSPYGGSIGALMARESVCFKCGFWLEVIDSVGSPGMVVADGWVYSVNPEQTNVRDRRLLGFGGDFFEFHTTDGRCLISNNVGSRGQVPDRFRALLPDTAIRVAAGERTRPVHH